MAAAARLLAARALTIDETRRRLAKRGYASSEIARCVSSLTRLGYLDDRALAYNVATSFATRKPFGRARVAAELKRRGLAPDIVTEAVGRAFAEVDEDEMALRAALALTRTIRTQGPDGAVSAQARARASDKLTRALLRRGFSGAAVRRARGMALAGARDRESDADPGDENDDGLRQGSVSEYVNDDETNHDDDFQTDP